MVVARYADGEQLRGTTTDFAPGRETFHVMDSEGQAHGVALSALQALFFVRDLHAELPVYDTAPADTRPAHCKEVIVTFSDGTIMRGVTMSFSRTGAGFFIFVGPSMRESVKIFVVHAAIRNVKVRQMLSHGRHSLIQH